MKKNRISIELHSLLRDIVRNIWVVILSALIGAMGFFIITHIAYEPAYTSSATLSVLNGNSNTASYSTYTVSMEQANVLVNIFTEPMIKEYAAEYLEQDSFDGTVSATVLEQTNFIELRVTSDHPEKSYKLLNAIIKTHHKVSNKIFRNAGLTVIQMPTVPTAPSNRVSNSNRNLVITGFATIALAIVIVLSLMRNTVKKEKDFDENIDSKLIGTVTHEDKRMSLSDIKRRKKKGLLIHNNAYISLRFTENFHKIAATLEHKQAHTGSKVFAITSVAENEGKSTCAANLAVSLADRGHKVLLIDLDFKKPAIFKIFDEATSRSDNLSYLLNKETPLENFVFGRYKKSSLFLAISTKANPSYYKFIREGNIENLIKSLREDYDFILIDTAPLSLDSSVTDIIGMVDKTILVIRTDTVSVNAINDAITTVSKISANLIGCILNDVHMRILPFSITGNDESNDYSRYGYGRYGYGGYGYGRYSNYGYYGRYSRHKHSGKREEAVK
ncbi:MAG: polysaccharide biosynthesis tyrosine autokinase [Clostridia bacterium]|nr:polysaccharide biosynthesis tyrosine autokinase [Clostridia bacterium]